MATLMELCVLCLLAISAVSAIDIRLGERRTNSQIRREIEGRQTWNLQKREDTDPELLYQAYNLSVPVDHFHDQALYEPHSNDTFPLRYWFDASFYKPGGPVIVLQGGETDGSDRLVYLQKGIVYQLSKATNGIGVILEHRYYGTSIPTPDFSTANLRFLTTDQALADAAFFAKNVQFPGLKHYGDLTSKTTAWISYGGSYAGAYSAFLRVAHPDAWWGSFSSSGVTKAIYDYWAYFKPIEENGPKDCITAQKILINIMDNIWLKKNDTNLPLQLKMTYGWESITHDQDFAAAMANGIYAWQSLNWDPEVGSNEFWQYCDNITSTDVLYPETESRRSNVSTLISEAGYQSGTDLENKMLNMIGYYNLTAVQPCYANDETLDECFTMLNETHFREDSLTNGAWRSWPYQYCSEYGFQQTGNTPSEDLPLTSRTCDLEYYTAVCRAAFNISGAPDVDRVNKYGAYDISYPRLAIIDGNWDPWKEATPHAFEFGAKPRTSTASEPFILIEDAVHHWDENGLFPNQTTAKLPPLPIRDTQSLMLQSLQEWLQEWQLHCLVDGGCS